MVVVEAAAVVAVVVAGAAVVSLRWLGEDRSGWGCSLTRCISTGGGS